jgi:hypothetical protein
MGAVRERGEGKLSAILWLAFFAAVIYAIFHVGPVYYDHYNLVDKMNELARAPRYNHPDDRIYDLLGKYVRENRLEGYVRRNSFSVSTVDTGRRISVDYTREAEVLPGWKHTFNFNKVVEQPLIY